MAEIESVIKKNATPAVGFRFITTESWNARKSGDNEATLTQAELNSSDIIFIEPLKQIYVGGVYFGVSKDQADALTNASTNITNLTSKVQTLEHNVGTTDQLSKALLTIVEELRNKIDGGAYTDDKATPTSLETGVNSPMKDAANIYDALNKLASFATTYKGIQSVASDGSIEVTTNDGAVNVKTDASKVKTTTALAQIDNKKGVTVPVGSSIQEALTAINGVLNSISATDAITVSAGKTTATSQNAQIDPSTLTNGQAIADTIERIFTTLLGTSDKWKNEEEKSLGQLRTLIDSIDKKVSSYTNEDWTAIQNAIANITAELRDPSTGGENLAGTFLDAVSAILPQKGNDGYKFTLSNAGGSDTSYSTLQDVITALNTKVQSAISAAGVTQITAGDGISVSGGGVGNVTVSATSAATLTAALAPVTAGATTGSGSTIQTALNDINTVAGGAASAANAAQTDATSALTQLKWTVV